MASETCTNSKSKVGFYSCMALVALGAIGASALWGEVNNTDVDRETTAELNPPSHRPRDFHAHADANRPSSISTGSTASNAN